MGPAARLSSAPSAQASSISPVRPHRTSSAAHLCGKGKCTHRGHKERRGKIKVSCGISERSKQTHERLRLGDGADDTLVGKPGGPCLVTIADR